MLSRWHGSTQLVAFTYSLTGQRATMSNEASVTAYVYDNRDRLITNASPVGTLVYAYDEIGNLTNMFSSTSGGISIGYQYDALNRLINVLDNRLTGTNNTTYTFDAVGNLAGLKYPNGVTNLWQYDARNRLTNLVWKLNATTNAAFAYQVEAPGYRARLDETVNGSNRVYQWAYDNLYRLKTQTITGAGPTGAVSYAYDAVGNRTNRTSTIAGLVTTNNYFDANDWLDADSNTNNGSAWFDANGSTRTNGAVVYFYDWANRLTNAVLGTTNVAIIYDGDGHRVKRTVTVGGTTTIVLYLVDDLNPTGYAQVLEEKSVSGGTTNLNRVYTYGLDLISQRLPGVSTNFYGYDGNGSTRCLLNLAGSVSDTYAYDAFGTLLASTGTTANNYRFQGEEWDANLGLAFHRARYYLPDAGRWLTIDTWEGNNGEPLSLHKYLFCANDPVNFWDPSGLARYEYDSQGLHVHDRDTAGKLTYMVTPQDDRAVTLSAKPGHEREFDAARARKHFSSVVNDPKEFKKIRDVVKDAYDRFSDKDGVARTGRNLRRSRFVFRSLFILSWGLALNPSNAEAVQRLKASMDKIDEDVRSHTTPLDRDIEDVMLAIKDIYGLEPAALWYWNRLVELQKSVDLDTEKNAETDPGKDLGSDIKINRPGGIQQISTFAF